MINLNLMSEIPSKIQNQGSVKIGKKFILKRKLTCY